MVLLRPYWRRRWTMIAVAWLVAVAGWIYVISLPDRFQATARIYVDTQNMLTPLLRNITVQPDIRQQIAVLQRTLLNRTNIARVAHVTNMDLNAINEYQKDQLYKSLSSKISIKAEGNNLFSIAFSNKNPQLSKQVVETILNLFVETNLGQNRTSMENAANFLDKQIREYEQKLKQADQRLADYKTKHLSILQATGANFSARLEAVRQRQADRKSAYDHAVVSRDLLKSTLEETPQFLDIAGPTAAYGGPSAEALAQARVAQLRQQLSQLRVRYTDSYPDVLNTQRDLEAAEAELATEKGLSANGQGGNKIPNPVFEQLKVQLVQTESDVAQTQIDLESVNADLARLETLGHTAPRVEADLADLTRQYSVIKEKYEELLSRRESARISEAVEASGDKVQFRVIEPPHVPSAPSSPNRPLLSTAVLVLAFGAGIGLIFLLHKLEDTIEDIAVLTNEFQVAVLGAIPKVDSLVSIRKSRRNSRTFAMASSSLLATYLMVLVTPQLWRFTDVFSDIPLPAFAKDLLSGALQYGSQIKEVLEHVGR